MTPIFFAYISRSGSTIVAKHFGDYKDIAVTPELSIFRFVNKTITSYQMASDFITILETDDRLASWNLNLVRIKQKLSILKYPIGFKDFHDLFIDEFLQNNKPKARFVINKTSVNGCYHRIKKLYPDAVFVFIVRDVRAIINSLLNTYDPYFKTSMIRDGNVFMLSFSFKRMINLTKKENKNIFLIKYEDFIADPDFSLKKVTETLGVRDTKTPSNFYKKNMSQMQQQLHKNLDKPLDYNRINAWEKELDKTYVYMFQKLTRSTLKELHYPIERVKIYELNRRIIFSEITNFIFKKKAGLGFGIKTALKKF